MNKKSLLVVTFGYPGSGKTYFSERLAKDLNLFHINSDKIRLEMFAKPTYLPEEHKMVFGFIEWLTQELLKKGMSVIVDANFNKRIHRKNYYKLAQKVGADYTLAHIKTPIEVAEKRILKRKKIKNTEKKKYYRPINLDILHSLKDEMEYPKNEPVIEIDGLKTYLDQIKDFKKQIKRIFT